MAGKRFSLKRVLKNVCFDASSTLNTKLNYPFIGNAATKARQQPGYFRLECGWVLVRQVNKGDSQVKWEKGRKAVKIRR